MDPEADGNADGLYAQLLKVYVKKSKGQLLLMRSRAVSGLLFFSH